MDSLRLKAFKPPAPLARAPPSEPALEIDPEYSN